jgi:hypothetical protein
MCKIFAICFGIFSTKNAKIEKLIQLPLWAPRSGTTKSVLILGNKFEGSLIVGIKKSDAYDG